MQRIVQTRVDWEQRWCNQHRWNEPGERAKQWSLSISYNSPSFVVGRLMSNASSYFASFFDQCGMRERASDRVIFTRNAEATNTNLICDFGSTSESISQSVFSLILVRNHPRISRACFARKHDAHRRCHQRLVPLVLKVVAKWSDAESSTRSQKRRRCLPERSTTAVGKCWSEGMHSALDWIVLSPCSSWSVHRQITEINTASTFVILQRYSALSASLATPWESMSF